MFDTIFCRRIKFAILVCDNHVFFTSCNVCQYKSSLDPFRITVFNFTELNITTNHLVREIHDAAICSSCHHFSFFANFKGTFRSISMIISIITCDFFNGIRTIWKCICCCFSNIGFQISVPFTGDLSNNFIWFIGFSIDKNSRF